MIYVRKILLALCVLLLTSPAWAAEPIIQGDAQFVYSQEIDGVVNPEIESVYKYTSVISASPAITLEGLDAIFPSRLDGMAFSASYTHESGKSGIYPGIFTFQFTEEEILAFPNGAVIMNELESSEEPVDTLFKYFDPVFVIYGTDGEKVSINIKNFSFDFDFITGENDTMALFFPVVLADGYPDTFCIEYVSEYPVVYDAMVSETNAAVSGDGNIEVAFALVPNEKATNSAWRDFPLLEPNGEKGYVIFDDPSEYLGIPETSDVSAAVVSSGETVFIDTENGFSFAVNTDSERNAVSVRCAIHSGDSGVLAVNGHQLDTEEILLPDGTKYLVADFVLVNGVFVTDSFSKNGTVYIFDGSTDDVLSAGVEMVLDPSGEAPLLSTPNVYLKRADLQIGLQEADAVFELAEAALWPGKAGVSAAMHVGSFIGTYEGTGKYVPLDVTISVTAEALQALSRNGYNTVLSVWEEDPFIFFDYFHVYKQVGDFVYDLVAMDGGRSFIVSGDPTTRVNISFQVALIDDVGFVSFDDSALAFIIYDGERDGKLVDPLFIGVPESGDNPERPVFNSPGVSLKLANIDASSLGLEEAEADFEYLGLTDWPGKEGVLDAVSAGSFEGEYDGAGKYVPLRMEVSVTSYDLGRLSKDRHAKVISKWTEDRTAFLDYFHVYKQVGDLVYDLVMLGGKEAFTVSGDPTTRVTVSFPAILIDDAGNTYYDEEMGFVIYDGDPDGKLVDPLFVGTPEQVPADEGEEDDEGEEELKHILPDNPEGPSTGHSDLDKWFKIFSLF